MKKTSDGWFVYDVPRWYFQEFIKVGEYLQDPCAIGHLLGECGMSIWRAKEIYPEIDSTYALIWIFNLPMTQKKAYYIDSNHASDMHKQYLQMVVSPVELPYLKEAEKSREDEK